MNGKSIPTTDEIISLLSHSSLPTVIIEGIDDVIVYRKMEDIFSEIGLSIMPVHGRNNVLKIFEKLEEIRTRENIAFIADRDLWVISGVPEKYISDKLIFTNGYSIENDIFKDCKISDVMNKKEKYDFLNDISKYTIWYALAVRRTLQSCPITNLKIFPSRIIDDPHEFENQTLLNDGETYPDEIHNLVKSDFEKYIRGKSLMQIATRQLSKAGRDPKIHTTAFMGIAPANPGPLLTNLFESIGKLFNTQHPAHL